MLRTLLSNQRFWAVVVLACGVLLARQFRSHQRPQAHVDSRAGTPKVEKLASGTIASNAESMLHANGMEVLPPGFESNGPDPVGFSSRSRLHAAATVGSIILHSAPAPPSDPIYYPPTLQEGLGQAQLQPPIPREFPESVTSLMPIRRPPRDAVAPPEANAAEQLQQERRLSTWPDEDFEKKMTPKGRNLLDPRTTDWKPPTYLEQPELRGGTGIVASHVEPASPNPTTSRPTISAPAPQVSGPNAHIIRQPNRSPHGR